MKSISAVMIFIGVWAISFFLFVSYLPFTDLHTRQVLFFVVLSLSASLTIGGLALYKKSMTGGMKVLQSVMVFVGIWMGSLVFWIFKTASKIQMGLAFSKVETMGLLLAPLALAIIAVGLLLWISAIARDKKSF